MPHAPTADRLSLRTNPAPNKQPGTSEPPPTENNIERGKIPTPAVAHLRLERPLCVLDVETTGLDPAVDRIVEVAVLKLNPGAPSVWGHRRLDPGVRVPPAATAVHGLTDADLVGCRTFAAVARRLSAFLAGADFAGFNLPFDLAVLTAEFARAGVPFELIGRACVDALTLFRRQKPHTLTGAVAEYLGRRHTTAHSARGDVAATLAVLEAQLGRDVTLPRTPAGLHVALIEVDLAGRFRRGSCGEPMFAYGKYRGQTLTVVARTDPAYLRWLLATLPLLDDARRLIERSLDAA